MLSHGHPNFAKHPVWSTRVHNANGNDLQLDLYYPLMSAPRPAKAWADALPDAFLLAVWTNHTTGEIREQMVTDPRRKGWQETTTRRLREWPEHVTPHTLLARS